MPTARPRQLPRQLPRQPRRTPRSISSFCLPLSRAALPRRRANATLGRGQSGQCGVVGIHRNCLRSWHCAGLRGLTGSVIVASGYLPGALRLAFAIDSTISGGRSVDHTESRTEQRTESARPPAPRRWPRCQEAGLGGGRVTSRWQAAAGVRVRSDGGFPSRPEWRKWQVGLGAAYCLCRSCPAGAGQARRGGYEGRWGRWPRLG
jgi:hypothetical protein